MSPATRIPQEAPAATERTMGDQIGVFTAWAMAEANRRIAAGEHVETNVFLVAAMAASTAGREAGDAVRKARDPNKVHNLGFAVRCWDKAAFALSDCCPNSVEHPELF